MQKLHTWSVKSLPLGIAAMLTLSANAGDYIVTTAKGEPCETSSWKDLTISPVANMLYFEDPIIHNEFRPAFIYHRIDDQFITGGGEAMLAGAQIRLAVTDRFQVIVNKGGYVWIDPGTGRRSEGFANLVLGGKYVLIDNEESQFILTPGLTYEIPVGDKDIFHGTGDGILHLFTSAAKGWGDFHLTGQLGWMQALDTQANSSLLHYNVQADYWLHKLFIPFVTFSGWTVGDAGNALALRSEGNDTMNFGASQSQGVTQGLMGVGFRSNVMEDVQLGVAWQKAVITPEDLYDHRFTFDCVFPW